MGDYRRFDREEITVFDLPENFTRQERTLLAGNDMPEQTSIADLDVQIDGLARAGTTPHGYAWSTGRRPPRSPRRLVTVLLGLPFAFKVGRRGSMYGVGVGLGLAIVFLGDGGDLQCARPRDDLFRRMLAAWSPNVVFAAVGAYLSTRMRRLSNYY